MGLTKSIKRIKHKIKKGIKKGAQKALGKDLGRFVGNYANIYMDQPTDYLGKIDPLKLNKNTAPYSPDNWKWDAALYGGLAGSLLYGAGSLLGGGAGNAGSAAGVAGKTGGAGTMGNFNYGSLLGGIISGAGSVGSAAMSAEAAAKVQKMQIEWERERAQNAHQWEVQDLQNAGLNPILSAGGQGAATGGISAPMPDFSGIQNAGQNIANTILTSEQAKNAKVERDNIQADTELKSLQGLETLAQAHLLSQKERTELSVTAKNYAETMLFDQQFKQQEEKFQKELDLLQEQIRVAQLTGNEKKVEISIKKYEDAMKKYTWILNQINNLGRTGAAALLGVSGTAKTIAELMPAGKQIGFLVGK